MEQITLEYIYGNSSVVKPCHAKGRKIVDQFKKVILPFVAVYGTTGPIGGVVYLLRSIRWRINNMCFNKCRANGLIAALKTETDPKQKAKYLKRLSNMKKAIAMDDAWLNRRFTQLKVAGHQDKLNKFKPIYSAVKRM